MLAELSTQTQFVFITHNSADMKWTGSRYSATLGEDGVSRIRSLRLYDTRTMPEAK